MANKKHAIPTQIIRMIDVRQFNGYNSREIAAQINGSRLAKRLGVKYSPRSVAAIMANVTMGHYDHRI